MKNFTSKVAAVTGAASGIGRALARELAQRGCHLALSDLNPDELAKTAEAARAFGVRVTTAVVDVSDRRAVEEWATRVVADHDSVNMIFNNAGVSVSSTVEGIEYRDFEWIMNINFWGVVHGTKAFLPYLTASGDGHVINVSSVFGLVAQSGQSAYNASKFAVRGFTESLRQELEILGSPVSATCVHPGGVRTNIARDARYSDSMKEIIGLGEQQAKTLYQKYLITTPEEAAQTILAGVAANKRRVLVGRDAYLLDRIQRLLPAGYQGWLVSRTLRRLRAAGRTLTT